MGNLTSHDLRDVGQERAILVTQKGHMEAPTSTAEDVRSEQSSVDRDITTYQRVIKVTTG